MPTVKKRNPTPKKLTIPIFLTRAGLVSLAPVLPLAFLIDLLVGDWVTGSKTKVSIKFAEHKSLFSTLWNC